MQKVIIFKNNQGGVSVIHPMQQSIDLVGIENVAKASVPHNKPYKIIDASELPSRETRNQWDVDEADLTDGVGAEWNTLEHLLGEQNVANQD